jgi:hypothetical protein
MKRILNDRMLKTLKPAPAGRRYDLMDSIVPGLGVRVTDKGQRTFVLRCRSELTSRSTIKRILTYILTYTDRCPGAAGSGAASMQPLMHDQPQPTCGRPENSSAERSRADHNGAK